jgi:asparagine synthase (glutamine-hydrolysing)
MCGIAMIAAPHGCEASAIRAMTDLARHRGPDDEGYALIGAPGAAPEIVGGPATPPEAYRSSAPCAPRGPWQHDDRRVVAAFGHRRLSIIDVSVLGHQPMSTPDRRYWILYNGEIYNYRELASELAALGYQFTSHCDTEVILAAYAQWGIASLQRLNGMFAFVIYDARTGDVFLARDRFGIKPLYYRFDEDGAFAAASEIKQLTASPGWRPTLNVARASQFLDTGLTDDGDETMFVGVYHVPPGKFCRAPITQLRPDVAGRLRTERWYELRPAPFTGSFEAASTRCRELLTGSVQLMLGADVPLGSCLSGGIDSSSIVCLANRTLGAAGVSGSQHTFTAASDDPVIDERGWVADVVKVTGVTPHFITPREDGLESELAAMAWHHDEPVTSTSLFAQWKVFELAAEHRVKVVLDGQGADEAFAGYHSFFGPHLAALVRSIRLRTAIGEFRALRRAHGFTARTAAGAIARAALPTTPASAVSVSAMSYAQLVRTNLQMLLRFEDRNSMAHSVEARVPYLDHRLVEFALGLPDDYKLFGGVTKRVLREAMTGILPERIRTRVDKIGFATSEARWLSGQRAPWFRARIAEAVEESNGVVSALLLSRFDAMVAGTRPYDRRAWRAISFGQWLRTFAVAAPPRGRSR